VFYGNKTAVLRDVSLSTPYSQFKKGLIRFLNKNKITMYFLGYFLLINGKYLPQMNYICGNLVFSFWE